MKVHPSNTSRTCAVCSHSDKQSRVKLVFQCTACGNRTHADLNAARVIARKGSESVFRIQKHKSGSALWRSKSRPGRARK